MKIYGDHHIIRIMIQKQGQASLYLNLEETTVDEVINFITQLMGKQHISPLTTGKVTSIIIREYKDRKNGKSKSISVRGIEPKRVLDIITKSITKKN